MFTLVTGIVGRWRAVCVTALQRPNSDAAAIRIVVGIAAASLSVMILKVTGKKIGELRQKMLHNLETSILEEFNINWTQKLGAGISGPVRVCVKKSTQERFALKILIDRPKARNEVRLHMLCASHPNIVQIIDVYANSVQFPHESSPSSSRNKAVFIYTAQTAALTCIFFLQIALALQHCHSLNIAHRDLKPENLLFKDNSLRSLAPNLGPGPSRGLLATYQLPSAFPPQRSMRGVLTSTASGGLLRRFFTGGSAPSLKCGGCRAALPGSVCAAGILSPVTGS
ncbi:unnamed protein product [Ranitomeya imitator]|uniref:Protein kinase domain-containing protein n=1 Tax=Ranitomeya imitator TaxID=111125 RepID=A0ABN9LMX0_9NEOB|nr:unnamed protein product [Ranitomeya imitator]